MKNRLDWYVDGRNMRGEPVVYKAKFVAEITKDIEFYITYTLSYTENNDWKFIVFYYSPDNITPTVKNCATIEIGKQMAEEHLQGIFNGMKKLLDN